MAQHVEDEIEPVQDDVDGVFVVELLEEEDDDLDEVNVVPIQGLDVGVQL